MQLLRRVLCRFHALTQAFDRAVQATCTLAVLAFFLAWALGILHVTVR